MEELQNEFGRLTRHKQIKMDVDADSCYNKIVPSIGMLTLQKYGVPPKVCAVQGTTLEAMKCDLMTGLGLSELDYQHCITHLIHGTGHFAGHMDCDHEQSHRMSQAIGAWCQVTRNHAMSDLTLIAHMQHDAQSWRNLLNATGGELSENAPVISPSTILIPAAFRF